MIDKVKIEERIQEIRKILVDETPPGPVQGEERQKLLDELHELEQKV